MYRSSELTLLGNGADELAPSWGAAVECVFMEADVGSISGCAVSLCKTSSTLPPASKAETTTKKQQYQNNPIYAYN